MSCLINEKQKILITQLPYEIQEIIMDHLSDRDLLNISHINKQFLDISDRYIRWKAKIHNIPLALLPNVNLANTFIQFCRYTSLPTIFEQVDKKDLEKVMLLIFNDPSNYVVIGKSFQYAFRKDNKIAGWLLSCYYKITSATFKHHRVICRKTLRGSIFCNEFINKLGITFDIDCYIDNVIDEALYKNSEHVIYYILDNFCEEIPYIKKKILNICAINGNVIILSSVINKYYININEFKATLLSTHDNKIIEFLLKYATINYKKDLDCILDVYVSCYPKKDVIDIICKYKYNNYKRILSYMIKNIQSFDRMITYEDINWFLSKYGCMINSDQLRHELKCTHDEKVRNLFYEYFNNK